MDVTCRFRPGLGGLWISGVLAERNRLWARLVWYGVCDPAIDGNDGRWEDLLLMMKGFGTPCPSLEGARPIGGAVACLVS